MNHPQIALGSGRSHVLQFELQIERRSLFDLIPHPHNARTHSSRQIKQIAQSIKQFGFVTPVLVDREGTIIAGHGRVEAARRLGLESVPTVCLEHLSEHQVRAYRLADNKLAENAGWDAEILAIEFQHLDALDLNFDLSITGFEVAEIDLLINPKPGAAAEPPPDPVDDSRPPICQPGDVWQLGRHRIVCGDARDPAVYDQLMQGRQAQIVFTDPPYNVAIHGHCSGLGQTRHREFAMASGEMSRSEFTDFLSAVFGQLVRNAESGSLHYLCTDWRHLPEFLSAGQAHYTELKNLCVWAKDTPGMGSLYRSQHELVLVYKHGRDPHQNHIQLGQFGRNRSNVWKYDGVNAFARKTDEGQLGKLHPTVKPVDLVADVLLDTSRRGNLVLDAFLGSGTTLIAAERVGRCCRAIEIDPLYIDVAIRRWQRHSGQAAVHVGSGETFDARAACADAQPEARS